MINNILKAIVALSLILGVAVILPVKSYASTECVTQYGGGETCIEDNDGDLEVDKKIKNPKTGDFEDHVQPSGGSNPYTFRADETITFSIVVRNTGDIRIENIKLEDILPSFVKYRDGDGDGVNDNTKVEFDEFDLDAGEEKEFEFRAKVTSEGNLPKDDRVCLTNIAEAEGELENSDEEIDDADYSNFCIELPKVKGKESPKEMPVTGGSVNQSQKDMAKMILAGSVSLGLILVGFGLKKIAD